jgi:hypothetical protein
MVAKVSVVETLRIYLGEAHAFYFLMMGDLTQQLV